MSSVGGQRQAQAQREMEGPVDAQMRLLQAGSGITGSQGPLLAGRSQTIEGQGTTLGSILGGGLSLASLFGGLPGGGKGGGGFIGGGGIPIPGRNPFFS